MSSLSQKKILLLEDDDKIVEELISSLNAIDINKIIRASSYKEAIRLFKLHTFDILLIDIDLGKNKRRGDDFVRFARKQGFHQPVIYLTSYYTEKIYKEVKDTFPTSFLNKDNSLLHLRQALELSLNETNNQRMDTIDSNSDSIFVKINTVYKSIHIKDIAYFFAKDKATFTHSKGRNYPTSESLKNLETKFYNHNFVRAHKTYLVNLNKVDSVDIQTNKLFIAEEQIPIGFVYRKKILTRLNFLK